MRGPRRSGRIAQGDQPVADGAKGDQGIAVCGVEQRLVAELGQMGEFVAAVGDIEVAGRGELPAVWKREARTGHGKGDPAQHPDAGHHHRQQAPGEAGRVSLRREVQQIRRPGLVAVEPAPSQA